MTPLDMAQIDDPVQDFDRQLLFQAASEDTSAYYLRKQIFDKYPFNFITYNTFDQPEDQLQIDFSIEVPDESYEQPEKSETCCSYCRARFRRQEFYVRDCCMLLHFRCFVQFRGESVGCEVCGQQTQLKLFQLQYFYKIFAEYKKNIL